jgi:hypothetical protein
MNLDITNPAFVKLVAIERSIHVFTQLRGKNQSRNAKESNDYKQYYSNNSPSVPLLHASAPRSTDTLSAILRSRFWMIVFFHFGSP